jgi:hypothetical protein
LTNPSQWIRGLDVAGSYIYIYIVNNEEDDEYKIRGATLKQVVGFPGLGFHDKISV